MAQPIKSSSGVVPTAWHRSHAQRTLLQVKKDTPGTLACSLVMECSKRLKRKPWRRSWQRDNKSSPTFATTFSVFADRPPGNSGCCGPHTSAPHEVQKVGLQTCSSEPLSMGMEPPLPRASRQRRSASGGSRSGCASNLHSIIEQRDTLHRRRRQQTARRT